MLAGLSRKDDFERLIDTGFNTFDFKDIEVYAHAATAFANSWFGGPVDQEALDYAHDNRHEEVLSVLRGLKLDTEKRSAEKKEQTRQMFAQNMPGPQSQAERIVHGTDDMPPPEPTGWQEKLDARAAKFKRTEDNDVAKQKNRERQTARQRLERNADTQTRREREVYDMARDDSPSPNEREASVYETRRTLREQQRAPRVDRRAAASSGRRQGRDEEMERRRDVQEGARQAQIANKRTGQPEPSQRGRRVRRRIFDGSPQGWRRFDRNYRGPGSS